MQIVIDIPEDVYEEIMAHPNRELREGGKSAYYLERLIQTGTPQGRQVEYIKSEVLDKVRAEIEQLPTNTRTNWDGCCPDNDYPEIEYVDVSKNKLLEIIDRYRTENEG